MDLGKISLDIKSALNELFLTAPVKPGQILVVGCSTSEVYGQNIGRASNHSVAQAIATAIIDTVNPKGIFLAAQCCEHLNRALVVEEEMAEKYQLEIVAAVPVPKAGGAFATAVRDMMKKPVLVEHIKAHWGLDIGNTLIGMHMKHVAVPVRVSVKQIGQAHLASARFRPKLIGGARTVYDIEDQQR